MSFNQIKQMVRSGVLSQKTKLFTVQVEKDELYNLYLAALPEDERAEHTCNCCRSFINNYGHIVALKDGRCRTVWDFEVGGIYSEVPKALHMRVLSRAITGPFFTARTSVGTDYNYDTRDGKPHTRWEHFTAKINRVNLMDVSATPAVIGKARTNNQVAQRGLSTISAEAVNTVLGLIRSNSLYRGPEFLTNVESFQRHLLSSGVGINLEKYCWENFDFSMLIRNTAIGVLLVDLSEGMDLIDAVRKFEQVIVPPSSFKRSKALISEQQINSTKAALAAAGCEDAIYRRYATPDDISAQDLLYVNRSVAKDSNDPFATLSKKVKQLNVSGKPIALDKFLVEVLPQAKELEVLVENRLTPNFMSLIAPMWAECGSILAWDSGISWDYNGNVTDSLSQRVKAAGGEIEGELRASLEWFNVDDLDIHMELPNGETVNFCKGKSSNGNYALDVDMNANSYVTDPVENIVGRRVSDMQEGLHTVKVRNYCKRAYGPKSQGFNVQLECQGQIIDLSYPNSVANHSKVVVAMFTYSKKKGISNLKTSLSKSLTGKEVYGLTTNSYHKVSMMLNSPNHWGNKPSGNKHVFFVLEGAKNDGKPRGFYNEFLSQEFQPHRKVLEHLSASLLVKDFGAIQLSGLGFSSTQENTVTIKVDGAVYTINTKTN